MLGRYGEFPFYRPSDDIYQTIFGPAWKEILKRDGGYQKIEDTDLEIEKKTLEHRLRRGATEDELVLYLQHPNDAMDFFKFEVKYGKTWVLPPSIWFKRGGFDLGERLEFPDASGKRHSIEMDHQRKTKAGDVVTHLIIDHHPEPILTELGEEGEGVKRSRERLHYPRKRLTPWQRQATSGHRLPVVSGKYPWQKGMR